MNEVLTAWEAAQARAERRRWLASLVLLLLCSVLAAGLRWLSTSAPPPLPAAAMTVELAPMPQSPPQPSAQPPGPQQTEAPEPAPPEPEPEPEPVKEPEPEPVPEPEPPPLPAEVLMPEPPEPSPPRRASVSDKASAPASTAPPAQDAAKAEVAAAPSEGALSQVEATARLSFQQLLLGHLERYKRYPASAQRRRQQGVPYVRFTMDRDGVVLAASLEQTSGHAPLDDEALALLARAQPLPPLPDEIRTPTLEVVVPVEFFLRR